MAEISGVIDPDSANLAVQPLVPDALPARWARAIALDTALRHAIRVAPAATDTSRASAASRARLAALLTAETAALAALQAGFDSLKASLPEVPTALPEIAVQAPDSARLPAPDSVATVSAPAPTLPPPSRWSVALLLETTPAWSLLPTAATPPDDRERVQNRLTQSVQVQRTLGDHWRLRAGFGQTLLATQARRTSERSGDTTIRDSVRTTTVSIRSSFITSQIIRLDTLLHIEPILNQSGQLVGYDTSRIPTADTVYVPLEVRDTLRQTRTTITTRTETWRETQRQLFRPTYRFWAIPFAAEYVFLKAPRWTLGAEIGGQLSIFRGGERPVWTGDEYAMRRISAREGPYRPVSLSFSTGLVAAYRLSPRLTAMVAPTARGWLLRPGKAEAAAPRLLPGVQVGVMVGL